MDNKKNEHQELAEMYSNIENYEVLQEEYYKAKYEEIQKKIKEYSSDERNATEVYYKILYEHHSLLKVEASKKYEIYSSMAKGEINDDEEIPF